MIKGRIGGIQISFYGHFQTKWKTTDRLKSVGNNSPEEQKDKGG